MLWWQRHLAQMTIECGYGENNECLTTISFVYLREMNFAVYSFLYFEEQIISNKNVLGVFVVASRTIFE